MKKSLTRVLSIGLCAVLILGLTACGSAAPVAEQQGSSPTVEPVRLRMQSSWSSSLLVQKQADDFAKLCEELSNGTLLIESLTGGSIVGAMEVFDAVDKGIIDISHSCAFNWVANEPAAPLFGSRPLGLNAEEYMVWLYDRDGLDMWAKLYEKYNFGYVAACGMNYAEDFAWTNKEIKSLEDMKGLKFRTVGYWGQILNSMGASVVTLPGGELYSALDTGVLDAAEFANPEADYGLGLHEVCKYLYTPGYHQPTSICELIVNKDVWDSLSPEHQAIIKVAAKSVTLDGFAVSATADIEALRKFAEYGTIINPVPEDIVAAIEESATALYAKLCEEDPFFREVYESQEQVKSDVAQYWYYMGG